MINSIIYHGDSIRAPDRARFRYPNAMKRYALICILLLHAPALCRTGVVLFPLVDATGDELTEWVGNCVPAVLFEELSYLRGMQVWDPLFLFPLDSSARYMETDSALQLHRARWQWQYAVGGRYFVKADTVRLELRIVSYRGNAMVKKRFRAQGPLRSLPSLCGSILRNLLSCMGQPVGKDNDRVHAPPITTEFRAFATYLAGYGFELHGRYADALTAYGRAIEQAPDFSAALCRMGALYARSERTDLAREYLSRAVEASPRNSHAAAELVETLVQHGSPGKALEFALAEKDVLSQTSSGLRALGRAYLKAGQFQRATASLTRAIDKGPSDLECEFILARVCLKTGDFTKASELFNRLITFRPHHMRYYSFLAAVYRKQGRLMESVQLLQTALERAPDNPTTLFNLAHTYFELGWYEKARDILERTSEQNPHLEAASLNLGVLSWHRGSRRRAVRVFSEAVGPPRHTQHALNNLGNTLLLQGKAREAVKAYEKALDYGAHNETVLRNLSIAYRTLGKFRPAYRCLKQVAEPSSAEPELLMHMAALADTLGENREAEQHYRAVLDLAPNHETALEKLVGLLRNRGAFEDAVRHLETWLETYPGNRRARIALARTYEMMAWYDVAVTQYEQVVQNCPRCADALTGLGRTLYESIVRNSRNYHDRAIEALTHAVELSPANAEPEMLLGKLYLDDGQRDRAIHHFTSARAKSRRADVREEISRLIAQAGGQP